MKCSIVTSKILSTRRRPPWGHCCKVRQAQQPLPRPKPTDEKLADAVQSSAILHRWDLRIEFRILFSCLLYGAMAISAAAENAPGVTDSEIKIGQTMPYTGPAVRFSAPGLAEMAYMKMINDQGGINGRKINLISVDDGYTPWRTANETRKLIEVEKVAFIFGSIGTPTQLSVAKYLNDQKIPQLFIDSGAHRWGNYRDTPYTIGGVLPTYRVGARYYTRHILKQDPNAKICSLYQNDAFGRDYPAGVRDVLGDRYAATVKEATYEFTDVSVEGQILALKA